MGSWDGEGVWCSSSLTAHEVHGAECAQCLPDELDSGPNDLPLARLRADSDCATRSCIHIESSSQVEGDEDMNFGDEGDGKFSSGGMG